MPPSAHARVPELCPGPLQPHALLGLSWPPSPRPPADTDSLVTLMETASFHPGRLAALGWGQLACSLLLLAACRIPPRPPDAP